MQEEPKKPAKRSAPPAKAASKKAKKASSEEEDGTNESESEVQLFLCDFRKKEIIILTHNITMRVLKQLIINTLHSGTLQFVCFDSIFTRFYVNILKEMNIKFFRKKKRSPLQRRAKRRRDQKIPTATGERRRRKHLKLKR